MLVARGGPMAFLSRRNSARQCSVRVRVRVRVRTHDNSFTQEHASGLPWITLTVLHVCLLQVGLCQRDQGLQQG